MFPEAILCRFFSWAFRALFFGMPRKMDAGDEPVSKQWSCTTLGEGIAHVESSANTDDAEERALLAELEEL